MIYPPFKTASDKSEHLLTCSGQEWQFHIATDI